MISSDSLTVHIFQNMSSLPVPIMGFFEWNTTVHTDIVCPFLSLAQNCLFVVKRFGRPGECRLILWKGCKLGFLAIGCRLGVDRGERFLFEGCFCFEFVPFYLDEHLLLHGEVVLFSQFLILLLMLSLCS